jgi:peptidoglycan/LPS O-acetylase OafA/YrhL
MSMQQAQTRLAQERPRFAPAAGTEYNLAIGYLRAAVTVLVIAHHAFVAYCTFLPPDAPFGTPPGWWKGFPVIDAGRWVGFDVVVACNDIFFMSLMFFISGLFVWSSLRRKGGGGFQRDRALRLGVPFLVAAAIVAPLAYYPTYLMTAPSPAFTDFARRWLALGDWPAGPAWFIWVLLAFDWAAARIYAATPRWDDAVHRDPVDRAFRNPTTFFRAIVAVTAAVYMPVVLAVGPLHWTLVGPFAFQTSRLLHYATWFAAGVAMGAYGIERGFLASDGLLARRWPQWVGAAMALFGVAIAFAVMSMSADVNALVLGVGGGLAFVLTCAALSLAATAVFVRFARTPAPALDSLRDNAYGMFLVHYPFVTWLQYALLNANLPAVAKGAIAFVGATVLSWSAVAAMRRIPTVARVI